MKILRHVGNIALAFRDCAGAIRRLIPHATFAAFALLTAGGAHAQLLDGVDVQDGEGAASQIIVRFAAPVQYLRHAPLGSGSTLRVYIQVTGSGVQPADMMPATLRFRGSARVPPFSATFPEPGNALMLVFDREVRFSAGPGPDNRSVAVTVSAAQE